jgi:hypothetical protein
VTSIETISNEAPFRCHAKKGGHVSWYWSMPRTPSLGGGTSNIIPWSAGYTEAEDADEDGYLEQRYGHLRRSLDT